MVMYCMIVSLGSMSFNVGVPCIGLINTLSFLGSKHRCTIPLGFGTKMKLLHHSVVSSIPSGPVFFCSCSLSNSILSAFVVCMLCILVTPGVALGHLLL